MLFRSSGSINICYPLPTIQAVNEYLELAAGQMDSYYGKKTDPATRQNMFTSLLEVQLPVNSILGEATIRGSDLMKLKKGDIIVLNRNTADVLPLNVAGKQMFVGRPGRIKNNLFVKICERCKKNADGPDVNIDWNEK